jgi:hypothetical protein
MLTALKGSGTDMECKPPSAFGFGRNYFRYPLTISGPLLAQIWVFLPLLEMVCLLSPENTLRTNYNACTIPYQAYATLIKSTLAAS